jgi:predicted Ser/Thr protein kinase
MISGLNEINLQQWIETSLQNNSHTLAEGYQGKTLLYEDSSQKFVIKAPHGSGLIKYIHILMLRHENKVYKNLSDFSGAPKCYGMIDNRYLVIEYINGQPIRKQRPANDQAYFEKLFELIEQMHRLNVAHMDLKKKDNLLTTENDQPYLIDFGAAVIKKKGLHPFNSFWYKLAKRFDYNAWIKHKYHNRMDEISDNDQVYYKQTLTEKYAGLIKKAYTKIKSHINKKT